MTRQTRVVINGFGRIGRTLLRQILLDPRYADIEVVAINDIACHETCAYLFRYDSVYGPFPGTVVAEPNKILVGGHPYAFWGHSDLRNVDLSGVDVVLECTGIATNRAVAEAGLISGAKSVLISGPSDAADVTAVLGANEHEVKDARIVSNASCTTNALAPLLRILNLGLGIEVAHVTTIHCYTGSQPTVDTPAVSLERSRAAAISMVPTTTSAAHQIQAVLPGFQGNLSVAAVRVPCISVSAIDATLQISDAPDEPITDFLKDAFANCRLIGLTNDACVSTDFRGRSESLILALPQTQLTAQKQLRVFGWYDNEWGFSARMIEMARHLAARE